MGSNRRRNWTVALALLVVTGCGGADSGGLSADERAKGLSMPAGRLPGSSAESDRALTKGNVDGLSMVMQVESEEGLDGKTCARLDVLVERIRPRVVFLVDSSSSMREDFGGQSRWDALREALLADDGVVPMLHGVVKFGLVTFAGPRFTTCPSYRYAAPAPGNADFVDAAFPEAPPEESSTPTGPAMDWAIDNAFVEQVAGPDMKSEPQYMIFATDGEPNGCADGATTEPEQDFDGVIAAAHKAAGREIRIFVLSLAEASGEFADHLDEVASIGETDKVFSPTNKEALVDELLVIIGAAISCELEAAGRIAVGRECEGGEVWLDDELLECDGDDGWELVDASHIRLKGQACEDYRFSASASVRATFPCGLVD